MSPTLISWLLTLGSALQDLALALLLADFVFPASEPSQRRPGLPLLGLGLITSLLALTLTLATDSDISLGNTLWLILSQTHSGRMLAMGAFATGLLWFNPGRPAVRIIGCGLLLFCRAASGHAADQTLANPAVLIQSLHLLAISLWVGGVVHSAGQSLKSGTLAPHQAQHLSTWATIALPAVVLSGSLNLMRLPQPPQGWHWSAYTACLSLKLACLALASLLGAYNRWAALPGLLLRRPASTRRFCRVLQIEALLLILCVIVAARLGSTMPG